MDRNKPSNAAFTLVELLVVITIIVVLLALLTPALDKAIYQAQLAVCGARMKAGAFGVLQYAMENKRGYPVRLGPQYTSWGAWNCELLADRLHDDRAAVLASIDPKFLSDPFCPWVADITTTQTDNMIFSDLCPWFGFRYMLGQEKGMYRLGDRFTHTNGSYQRGYSVLLCDRDRSRSSGALIDSTHPDREGRLDPVNGMQDSLFGWALQQGQATYVTYSGQWQTRNGGRGVLDLNYAYDDGSVERFNAVELNDSRMDFVSENNINQPDQLEVNHRQLPKR